ncbi:MAG: hypothetical protein A4S09_02170 [Proteobacteria bacterium SG_bin7]|nr:MAG: hypothetical protein A4S09_02170 [Proteobacteria bacterium SG_bin7]
MARPLLLILIPILVIRCAAGSGGDGSASYWTKQLGVASVDTNPNSVLVDSGGYVYVGGQTQGGLDGNTLTGTHDAFITKYNSQGAKQSTIQFGVTSGSKITGVTGLAKDSSNKIFVSGSTNGDLFGAGGPAGTNYFLIKYDSSGNRLWTKQGGAGGLTRGNGVSVAADGSSVIVGDTSVGLDGVSMTGSTDFFVVKYNSAGTRQWTKQLGVATKITRAIGVVHDSSSNVYVTGTTNGGLDGNTLGGVEDLFLTKYDSSGNKIWTKQMSASWIACSSFQTSPQDIAKDSSDNVYITGVVFCGVPVKYGYFVAKYNSSGTLTAETEAWDTSSIYATSIAIDGSNNAYIAGTTMIGLNGSTMQGVSDLFLMKIDSSGNPVWTKQKGTSGASLYPGGLASDSSGNIFVTAETNRGMDGNTQTGTHDFVVFKFNSSGSLQ